MTTPRTQHTTRGYMTLMSVIILSSIGTAITVSLLLFGITNAHSSYVLQQSLQANTLAHACAEEALEQIRESDSFVGSGSITHSTASCSYTVRHLGGAQRSIEATGAVENVVRKVHVSVDNIGAVIVLNSWQEVPDF